MELALKFTEKPWIQAIVESDKTLPTPLRPVIFILLPSVLTLQAPDLGGFQWK